jgi:membrane protease YdiL (CAAX protease family)
VTAISSALLKVAISSAAIALVMARIRSSKDFTGSSFGFVLPKLLPSLGFIAVYLGWMLLSDVAVGWRGPWDFTAWKEAPMLASVLRVLAVCFLGPVAEELVFRSLFFRWLNDRLNTGAVIAVTSIGWALLHWTYSWVVIAIIGVDGILLGLARWKTRSIVPPIAMHSLYNLYAIW